MFSRTSSTLIVVALAVAEAFAADAKPARISRLDWQTGPLGTARLTLVFDASPPRVEATAEPWGLGMWLPGVAIGDIPMGEIRAFREEEGTRLRLERAGAALKAVRVAGTTVEVDLSMPEPETVAAQPKVSYPIGIGDTITLAVYKNSDLSGDFTVGSDGSVSLPLIGNIHAAGRTEGQLAAEVTRVLARDYLVDPQVTVSVKTYQSQFAYVTGSVVKSTRVPLQPSTILKDVLSEAGVALLPGQELILNRAGGSGESFRLNAADLEGPNAPAPRDGDVLTVQEPRYVYIQGEVRRQGRLVLTPGLTLIQAITMAEGLTDWASKKEVRILRKVGEKTESMSINLRKVEERAVPDPELRPDDVVLVRKRVL